MSERTTYDHIVEALRDDLAKRGHVRVILLGTERDMSVPDLRIGLARWGLQVLVPPAGERAWIAGLAAAEASADDVARLSALLADGIEHGVEALVVTEPILAELVRRCGCGVPVVEP